MSAFIQQLPALIGVVVGALGSYLAIVRGDRVRFRREQSARWDERRLTVYSDYAHALKKTVTLHYRIAAHLGNDPNRHPLPPEDAAPQLASALDALDPVWEALLMLGAPDAVERAREWSYVVRDMERFLETAAHDPEGWSALLARQRVARDHYYVTVRADLALPPGHSGRWALDR